MDKEGKALAKVRVIACIMMAIIFAFCVIAVFGVFEAKAEEEIIAVTETVGVKYTIDLTGIITAIIGLIFTFITTKLIPLIKAKTTKEQQETLIAIAKTVVYAAEQLYGAGHGEEKLDYALARLGEMGYKIDGTEVRAVVEAAVKELKLVG